MKKKITKAPKPVTMIYQEIISYISKYTCPSCHTTFVGAGISKKTLRFRCDCGQELTIIEKVKEK